MLRRLAGGTRCGRSFPAAEAVETHMDRELAIIEDIERGLADVKAGRTVSHEDAMASVRRAIEVATEQKDRIDPRGFSIDLAARANKRYM